MLGPIRVVAKSQARTADEARPTKRDCAMLKPRAVLLALLAVLGCTAEPTTRWWKGNLHTHSFWSDGDHYPEMVVAWYQGHGYDFIQLSDHNTFAAGDRWIEVDRRVGRQAYDEYEARFGADWVVQRTDSIGLAVRLKTFEEYRTLFEAPGRFLVIQGEEITDEFESLSIHVNATNLRELVTPQGGSSVRDVIRNNVQAVLEQRTRTGQPMLPHLNHPNYGWAVTAEDMIAVEDERFFEVYNGHPAVHNEGDTTHPSTERLWDIVLAERLSRGAPVVYGLAVDDAHNYHAAGPTFSNPGRGWIMVRAAVLTAAALIAAIEAGDFYATTGVVLDGVAVVDSSLRISIHPEPGVTYTTQFIGTRRGYPSPTSLRAADDSTGVTRLYPPEIGIVLSEVAGLEKSYELKGNALYVRAKVVSTKAKANPYRPGEVEVAWTQPVLPAYRQQER